MSIFISSLGACPFTTPSLAPYCVWIADGVFGFTDQFRIQAGPEVTAAGRHHKTPSPPRTPRKPQSPSSRPCSTLTHQRHGSGPRSPLHAAKDSSSNGSVLKPPTIASTRAALAARRLAPGNPRIGRDPSIYRSMINLSCEEPRRAYAHPCFHRRPRRGFAKGNLPPTA